MSEITTWEQTIDEYIKQRHYRLVNSVIIRTEDGIVKRYYNGRDDKSRNPIKSVAKSILSLLTGIALYQGRIDSLDTPIYHWIPEFSEGRDMLHKAIRLRHLLTMSSGIYWNGGVHYHCPMMEQLRRSGDWISHIADCAVTEMPGTKYVYKEWDVILLTKILECACGDLYDFLDENLYQPLGITSGRWYQSPCGIYYSVGDGTDDTALAPSQWKESHSNLSAPDMLKLGQLLLHKGSYEGKRILSEEYIDQATQDAGARGYGFLFWLSENRFACRGFGGQHIVIYPEQSAIIVIQATPTPSGKPYLDLIDLCTRLILH